MNLHVISLTAPNLRKVSVTYPRLGRNQQERKVPISLWLNKEQSRKTDQESDWNFSLETGRQLSVSKCRETCTVARTQRHFQKSHTKRGRENGYLSFLILCYAFVCQVVSFEHKIAWKERTSWVIKQEWSQPTTYTFSPVGKKTRLSQMPLQFSLAG